MYTNVRRKTLTLVAMTWTLCAVSRAASVPSPTAGCGPVCAIYCPSGNILDDNGCPTCQCKPGGAPLIQIDPVPIVPKVCALCLNYCYYGRETLSNGCPSCKCLSAPTSTKTTAKPSVCPQLLCRNYCLNGRVRDNNGCVTCRCQSESATKPVCTVSLPCYFSCNYEYQKPTTCDCDCYKVTGSSSSW